MTGRAPESYEQALHAVSALLAALPGPAMLIGGLVVIAHGHVRTTDDIDATASGRRVTPPKRVPDGRALTCGSKVRVSSPLIGPVGKLGLSDTRPWRLDIPATKPTTPAGHRLREPFGQPEVVAQAANLKQHTLAVGMDGERVD